MDSIPKMAILGRQILTGLICLCLMAWSVLPMLDHAPQALETVQDHLELIEDHGHSHGFEEDQLWAFHGHSHDAADHDHNQAFLIPADKPTADAPPNTNLYPASASVGPDRSFPIERPPRV